MNKELSMKTTVILFLATSFGFSSIAAAADTRQANGHRSQQVVSQQKDRLGTLSCEVDGGIGLLVGSSRNVDCRFEQRSGKVERYTGTIGKLGIDVGVTGKSHLA